MTQQNIVASSEPVNRQQDGGYMNPDTQTVANTVNTTPKPVPDSSVASSSAVAITLTLTAYDASTAARLRQRFPGAQMNDGSTGERGGALADDGPWRFRCSYPDMATARQALLALPPRNRWLGGAPRYH
jgi:hypothetical protein